jgi:hypothetical protein
MLQRRYRTAIVLHPSSEGELFADGPKFEATAKRTKISLSPYALARRRKRLDNPESVATIRCLRNVTLAPTIMSSGVRTCDIKPTVFGSA